MSAEGLNQEEVDNCIRQAESEGFTVVRGGPCVLVLDLDTPAAWEQYARVLVIVKRYMDVTAVEEWNSKSGNKHVRITLAEPWDITTRLLLQAALGSDGVKELLTVIRVWNGVDEPSMLFRPPNAEVITSHPVVTNALPDDLC